MLHKIFDNNLVAMRKSKLALKLNKPAYIGMCIFELSKVLMYEFHNDYIENKYDNKSKLLLTHNGSLIYYTKTEDVYEDFSSNKEMFDFSYYQLKSKYYDNSNKLVFGKMKDETGGDAIQEFVGLKQKMYSILVDNNGHKKAKGVNRNVVAILTNNKYNDVLLIDKCLRHPINIDHRIGTYEINKISFSCFDDKIKFKTMDMMDQLLVIRVNYKKTVILITI